MVVAKTGKPSSWHHMVAEKVAVHVRRFASAAIHATSQPSKVIPAYDVPDSAAVEEVVFQRLEICQVKTVWLVTKGSPMENMCGSQRLFANLSLFGVKRSYQCDCVAP